MEHAEEHVKTISPQRFHELHEENELGDALVIDVREPYEWDFYHLDGTMLMPMNTIPERLQELPKDRTIYVICAHGVRSHAVCRYLTQQGYGDIHNVAGGMAAVALLNGFIYD